MPVAEETVEVIRYSWTRPKYVQVELERTDEQLGKMSMVYWIRQDEIDTGFVRVPEPEHASVIHAPIWSIERVFMTLDREDIPAGARVSERARAFQEW